VENYASSGRTYIYDILNTRLQRKNIKIMTQFVDCQTKIKLEIAGTECTNQHELNFLVIVTAKLGLGHNESGPEK